MSVLSKPTNTAKSNFARHPLNSMYAYKTGAFETASFKAENPDYYGE